MGKAQSPYLPNQIMSKERERQMWKGPRKADAAGVRTGMSSGDGWWCPTAWTQAHSAGRLNPMQTAKSVLYCIYPIIKIRKRKTQAPLAHLFN